MVFFHASNPNPGLTGKTGLEIVLLRPDGKRVQRFIPYPKSDFSAARELVDTGIRDAIDRAMGVPIAAFGEEANHVFGPASGDYHTWLARIKGALDPSNASDPFFYAQPDQDPQRPQLHERST